MTSIGVSVVFFPGFAPSIPAALTEIIIGFLREDNDFVLIDTPAAFDDHVHVAPDQRDVVGCLPPQTCRP